MDDNNINDISPEDYSNAKDTDTLITKCNSCGGNMIYDPATKGLKCEYCGNSIPLSFSNLSRELDFNLLSQNKINEWGDEVHVFKCNNCGAKEIISKDEISVKCSFCGTSNVVQTDEVSGLKPNAIVPILFTKEAVCNIAVKWAKSRFFAPKSFKKAIEPQDVFGNYYPTFTFDSLSISAYNGVLGKYYYRIVRNNGKSVTKREIRWFRINGNYNMFFDDILVDAFKSNALKFIKKLSPYDTKKSIEYNPDFLQGYSASQYNKDGLECWHEAENIMRNQIRTKILARYNYDVVSSLNINTNFENKTFKYLLLPTYIGHISYKNKNYDFYVNGQTGKIFGKAPVSPIRVTILVVIILLVLLIFYYIYVLTGGELNF